ncbi:MAG: hypothetical protein WKF30_12970 [Pyrinomonadaceae bacterium]
MKRFMICVGLCLVMFGGAVIAWHHNPLRLMRHNPPPPIPNTIPHGWYLAGSNPLDYNIHVDTLESYQGKSSVYIQHVISPYGRDKKTFHNGVSDFGTLMQNFSATPYRGQRVRMSAYVKAERVLNYAGLWMRVDGESQTLRIDNMWNRPIEGTFEWQKFEVTLDVPEESAQIAFGFLLTGAGKVWVDCFQFESVGTDVATTGNTIENVGFKPSVGSNLPERPVNLNFEE